jgi:O-antigen/teichoic acid export membrane protein
MSTANIADARPNQPSLRLRTTRGVMWVAAQAGATRVVTLVQQIVLGWLLAKSDFGLIGLAYTVSSLVNLMANPGVDAVLVQRMRRYHLWATPAFWLGMTMGISGAAVMLALAPFAAWI